MIRDARDVLLSSKNRFSHYKIFPFLKRWEENLEFANQFAEHPNFKIVQYESLMLDTERVLKELETFLNIKLVVNQSQKLKNRSYEDIYNDNSSFGDISKLFDAKGVDRWKKSLESDEVLIASGAATNLLSKFNYEIPQSLSNKGRQRQLVFKYKIYRLYKRFTKIIRGILNR